MPELVRGWGSSSQVEEGPLQGAQALFHSNRTKAESMGSEIISA